MVDRIGRVGDLPGLAQLVRRFRPSPEIFQLYSTSIVPRVPQKRSSADAGQQGQA